MPIQVLSDINTAKKIGEFLTGEYAFDQIWAPAEKELVKNAPVESIGKNNHRYWYIEENGEIIAAMGVRENKYRSGGYEMDSDYLAVHRNFRKHGLASQLLNEVEKFIQEQSGRYLHVLSCDIDSYAPARAFYEKHGYKKVAEIPNYYVEDEGRIDYFKQFTYF